MAEASSKDEKYFTCQLCLELLKDPVTIPCGHHFCMGCINARWDQEDQKGVYSCPVCKHTFSPRPVLYKNPLIAEMLDKFQVTKIQAPSPSTELGLEDVDCDVCTGSKLKAMKSCLECLASYCETHFKAHNELHPGRKHSLIDATSQLKERLCTEHRKVLEIFCRTDQSCICYLCSMDKHKGHDTVTAAVELKDKQRRFQKTIKEREKERQELRKAVETLKSSAQTAMEDCERILTEMISSIEITRSEVTELIRAQEKAEVSRAEGLLKQLEQEIAELKRRDAKLEQLSQTEDHINLLKKIRDPLCSKDLPSKTFNRNIFEAMRKSVSALKMHLEEKLDGIFKQEQTEVSATVSDVQTVSFEPVSKEFLQYSCHFKLDPKTANRSLLLQEGNRKVDHRGTLQSYPNHPERFGLGLNQVLCTEGVSGRSYWEVEWRGACVNIAMSYKSINRKGEDHDCLFGRNNHSWSLELQKSKTSFWHNKEETVLPVVKTPRIGVYVDHRAGTLAFYSIYDTMTLLHRVQTTFTQPLYPGFMLLQWSSANLL